MKKVPPPPPGPKLGPPPPPPPPGWQESADGGSAAWRAYTGRPPLVEAELVPEHELPRVVQELADRIDASPRARVRAIKTWQTVRSGAQLARDMRSAVTALYLRDTGTREWLQTAIKLAREALQ